MSKFTSHNLKSVFEIKKMIKGDIADKELKLLHTLDVGLNGIRTSFEEGKEYILFLKSFKPKLFKLVNNDYESYWLKYRGKDRVRSLLAKEKIDKLNLKEQLLYEIGQWILNPYAPSHQKDKMLHLIIVSPDLADYSLFLTEHPWFIPILEKVKTMGGYPADFANQFLKLSKGEEAKLFKGKGKVYASAVTDDIENVNVRVISQFKEVFPKNSIKVIESQDEEIKIIRVIFKIPGYNEEVKRQLKEEVLKGVPYRILLVVGSYDQSDNFEIIIKDKGAF